MSDTIHVQVIEETLHHIQVQSIGPQGPTGPPGPPGTGEGVFVVETQGEVPSELNPGTVVVLTDSQEAFIVFEE